MLDYVDRVKICWKLEAVLKEQELWPDIRSILSKYLMFTSEMMSKVLGVGPFCYQYFIFFISDWCFSWPLLGQKLCFDRKRPLKNQSVEDIN